MSDTRLVGRTRWSQAAKCPRMAAMGLLGSEPEELNERTKGRMQRGKDAQAWHGKRLAARYGEDGIIREKAVPWPSPPALPVGELHTDFVIPSERLAMEVKSSEAVDSMFEISLTQLKGQIHFDPDVDQGALVFLDRDYQETDVFPVLVSDEDAQALDAIAAQVVEAGTTGVLPPRVCLKPSDGIGRFCPFIRECFEGWEPPPAAEQPDHAPLFSEAYIAKRDLDAGKANLKELEERWEAARQSLLEADLETGDNVAGPILVKRSDVKGRKTFSMSKAASAGLWTAHHEELFQAFVKVGDGHSRFEVRRISDDALEMDVGDPEDVPF